MDAQLRKLTDLTINQSYTAMGYKPVKTKYGDSFILACLDETSNEEFQIFATKPIIYYLENEKPKKKFNFTVKKCDKYRYVEIDGQKYNNNPFILLI
jgi:hypothetical protein